MINLLSKSSCNEIELVPTFPITFPAALFAKVRLFILSILFGIQEAITANTVSPAPETS